MKKLKNGEVEKRMRKKINISPGENSEMLRSTMFFSNGLKANKVKQTRR